MSADDLQNWNEKINPHSREMLINYFNHVEQQVGLAITTSALVVAADALILGGYITIAKEWDVFSKFGYSIAGCLFTLSGMYLVLGLFFSLLAVYPNVKSFTGDLPLTDIFFFGRVGDYNEFYEYLDAFEECESAKRLDRELLFQIWGKSKFLRHVFQRVQHSLAYTIIGTTLGAIVLFVCA